MKNILILGAGIILFMGSFLFPVCQSVSGTLPLSSGDTIMPIIIQGDEQSRLNMDLPDGGLPPLPGVHNIQLLRTTRRPAGSCGG